MKNRKAFRVWIWLLLVVLVAVLGFYLLIGREQKEPRPGKGFPPSEAEVSPLKEEKGPGDKEKEDILPGPSESKPIPEDLQVQEDPCLQIENQLAEFFSYLDGKSYIQSLDPNINTSTRFREILKQLEAMPPASSIQGEEPDSIIQNINHFFRVLDRKDFLLIKEIIENERDTFEIDLEMFYKWLILGEKCPATRNQRPSMEAVYQYAGFFLNTIGGRAYLLRRPSSLRLLISYYCILVIHEMDKAGKNNLGIDIVPFITPLKQEMEHYPELRFQQDYLGQLNRIETFYIQKRFNKKE